MVLEVVRAESALTRKITIHTSGNGRVIAERCQNPWNSECESNNIAVYIVYRGERIPLCWRCWREVSRKNVAWEGC
ncbi:MAG: hypothetical protein QW502_00830 [Candidatus Bathyarchaeia archaeon]|nr:hypothetical protein [Candidatus Bathyarchaeota archaeon]